MIVLVKENVREHKLTVLDLNSDAVYFKCSCECLWLKN